MRLHVTYDWPGNANRVAADLAEILGAVGAQPNQPPAAIYCAVWLQLNAQRPIGRIARWAVIAFFTLCNILYALVPSVRPTRRWLYLRWLGLRVSIWFKDDRHYQCAYCGSRTSMEPTVSLDGVLYPSCCAKDACLDRLRGVPRTEAA